MLNVTMKLKAFVLVGLLAACQGTYWHPVYGMLSWNFLDKPSRDQAVDAFGELESLMRLNLIALREAITESNPEVIRLAEMTIEKIADGKRRLRPFL